MRRLKQDESGATAVIVAILLTVLVGIAAFVVDIGDVLWERRMLQNSADAAALAVAIDCAQGDCLTYETTADSYAGQNNFRGAFVESVTGPDGGAPTFAGGEVTVVARTGDATEEGRLRQWFSAVLGANEGLATGASATATWGVPDLVDNASPLTISICAWYRLTGIDHWPPSDDAIAALPTFEEARTQVQAGDLGQTVYYKDPSPSAQKPPEDWECYAPPGFYNDLDSGEKLPGAFGWLESANCQVSVTTDEEGDQWAPSEPGNSAGNQTKCVKDIRLDDPPVAVFPIFVGEAEGNGKPDFQIVAPAAFYLTGFRLSGGGSPQSWSVDGGLAPCSNPTNCIRGFFVQKLDAGNPTDNVSFGLTSVALKN